MSLTVNGSFGSHSLLVALWPRMSIKTQSETLSWFEDYTIIN